MDATDSKIIFDDKGVCDYCRNYTLKLKTDIESKTSIDLIKFVNKIKLEEKNKQYDCIIGLSGGADSSYLVYYAKVVLGLRPLVFTVDTGWNLNVAIENIERLVKGLKLDLYTEVVNWNEMKDLQRSFFLSDVPYQDLPQDHVIFAGLYRYAVKHKIKYVLTGSNTTTEGVRPPIEWVYFNDIKLIKSIHKKYGKLTLKTMPLVGMIKYKIFYQYMLGMKRFYPLDYINYNKEEVEKLLFEKFGWQKYENKHYENVFTRFYEGYYLIKKFNYDKRKCYQSNLILSGQITREEALSNLSKNPYNENLVKRDMKYIAKKMGFSLSEFEDIINREGKSYEDYPNSFTILKSLIRLAQLLKIEKREFR
jgi:N-acetyl sugar amidotransferase